MHIFTYLTLLWWLLPRRQRLGFLPAAWEGGQNARLGRGSNLVLLVCYHTRLVAAMIYMQKQAGFTLIELMVTVSVLAIMLVIAVPYFRDTTMDNRLASQSSDFTTALAAARSEAAKRGVAVTVGAVGNVSGQFGGGWRVWVDSNGNRVLDASETLIRQHEDLGGNTLTNLEGTNAITYLPTGFLNITPATVRTFTLCDSRTGAKGKKITINALGWPHVDPSFVCT